MFLRLLLWNKNKELLIVVRNEFKYMTYIDIYNIKCYVLLYLVISDVFVRLSEKIDYFCRKQKL